MGGGVAHLDRSALAARLEVAPAVAVTGAAGAGKTTLVREAVAAAPQVVWVELDRPIGSAEEARRAIVRAVGREPTDTSASELAVTVGAGAVLVVDDVHRATGEAASFLAEVIGALGTTGRAVAIGRAIPSPIDAVVQVVVADEELQLSEEEVAALADRSGVHVSPEVLDGVARSSGRLVGAADLLLAAIAAAIDPSDVLNHPHPLRAAVQQSLLGLSEDERAALAHLARAPLLVDGVDGAIGAPGLLSAAREAGLPLHRDSSGRWALPDWIRDVLATGAALDAETIRALSAHYRACAEPVEAVATLLDAGLAVEGAALLACLDPAERDRVDLFDLDAVMARLPTAALHDEPRISLMLARACADAVLIGRRTELLHDLAAIEDLDPAVRWAVLAEQARDLARDGEVDRADELAGEILDGAGSELLETRAIACEVRGRAAAWWAVDERQLATSRQWLDQGVVMAQRARSADLESALLGFRGYRVHFAAGDLDQAGSDLTEAAALIGTRPRRRAMVLTFLAEVLHNAGDFDEAAAALDDADAVGARLRDDRLRTYVAWERARGAGWQGDLARLREEIGVVERLAPEWFDHPSGMVFLAEMADLLDRCGDPIAAAQMLERANARMAELAIDDPDVLVVASALEARRGSPERANELLDRLAAAGSTPPLRRWRPLLLRALASSRLGATTAGVEAAEAFETATRAGVPRAPLLLEPEATSALVDLAMTTGSNAAAALVDTGRKVRVTTLGGFSVSRAGVPSAVAPGHPTRVVKVVVALGGRVHHEVLIDLLWPDHSLDRGRKLLRNVLTRLRAGEAEGLDLVVRDGDALTLGPEVEVDVLRFEDAAERALSRAGSDDRAAVVDARIATALYRGELLPDDRYEEWAVEPRERIRARFVRLLRLLADIAARDGRIDEAVRELERAIAAEPLDVENHQRLITLLDDAGRAGAAAHARVRAEALAEELGLRAPIS